MLTLPQDRATAPIAYFWLYKIAVWFGSKEKTKDGHD